MGEKRMNAIVIYEAGGPEKLVYKEIPVPAVKPGWSLVRIIGRGVNHSEIFTRDGQSPSVTFPRILGIECVGVIEESTDPGRLPVGQKVDRLAMGDPCRAARDLLHGIWLHEKPEDHGRKQDPRAWRNERCRCRVRETGKERLQRSAGNGDNKEYAKGTGPAG